MTEPAPRLVYRWDLDKTYLLSELDSLRGLVKIPFERPEDKVAAPGVAALIRGLRESALSRGGDVRIYFLSASPPQIGRAIRRKLELDGIVHDGIVFKDQLQRLFRGKFRHLREQVGYKLTELLKARQAEPVTAREYLFGDDWESDPLIYSLYADVVAGRLLPAALEELLRAGRVDPPLITEAGALAEACARAADRPRTEPVARIFINLERPTPPAALRAFGARLVPTFNYLQTAACLFEEEALSAAAAVAVARSLVEESGYRAGQIANSLADIVRRDHLGEAAAAVLRLAFGRAGLLPTAPPRWRDRLVRRWRRTPPGAAEAPVLPDYRSMIGTPEVEAPGSTQHD